VPWPNITFTLSFFLLFFFFFQRGEGSSVSRRSASSEMSNVSRRGLTDVSGNVPVSGRGLYDMSNIELPPLPPRGGSYR